MRTRSSKSPASTPIRLSLRASRMLLVAGMLALGAATVGCSGVQGQPLTAHEIKAHGNATFEAPPGKVLAAVVDALRVLGYEIAMVREDRGLVITKPKVVREAAVGGRGSAMLITYTRQYTVKVEGEEDGPSTVTATPAVFVNSEDISSQPVWDLESPMGERALWKKLFQQVKTLL